MAAREDVERLATLCDPDKTGRLRRKRVQEAMRALGEDKAGLAAAWASMDPEHTGHISRGTFVEHSMKRKEVLIV